MENLRHLLKDYSPDKPIYFGDRLLGTYRNRTVHFPGGGAGYVFNRPALEIFTQRKLDCSIFKEACPEDLMFGVHMEEQGVTMGESRDEKNRTRFHSANIYYLADQNDKMPMWYKQMSVYFRDKVRYFDKISKSKACVEQLCSILEYSSYNYFHHIFITGNWTHQRPTNYLSLLTYFYNEDDGVLDLSVETIITN